MRRIVRRVLCLAAMPIVLVLTLAPTASAQEVNCDDFPNQAAAQQRLREDPTDPEGLDGLPGDAFAGIQGVACEHLPPPTDFDPVLPPGAGVPKGGPQPPVDNKMLMEAGGDLPLPPRSDADSVLEDEQSGSFPVAPAAMVLLSSGLLGFAVHRLVSSR